MERAIEEASLRAWPAIEETEVGGWTLRHSDGFTGRANSVQSLGTSALPLEDHVALCEAWYRERARPPLFRITPFSEEGLDRFLADRGYERFNRTLVLSRDVGGLDEPWHEEIELVEAELHEWLRRYAGLIGRPTTPAPMRSIIERAAGRSLPALLRQERPRRVVACGLAVLDDELLGLFDLVVDAERRRRGIGSELVRRLVAWGREGGAAHVHLQVTEDNAPALALYDRLGFRESYAYWYRIFPS